MRVRWAAPGRVNLIGEHTDYNAGFALPFAIAQRCAATVSLAGDGDRCESAADRSDEADLTISSAQRADVVQLPLAELSPGSGGWAGYAAGVVYALLQRGITVPGLRIQLDSDVPAGGGLSSSAALTCAVATALDDLLGLDLGAAGLLAVTRSAENDFVGAPTGGMDQLASLRCTADHVLFCDMRSLATEQVPFDLAAAGLALLVVDTRAAHRHADGEYRARREGCDQAAASLGLAALRDLADVDLPDALARLEDEQLRRYTRHVVTENARVLATVELLRASRLAEIGPLLTASHVSLRDDYQVSVPELDIAVEALLGAGALGARLTGGGFGGSVIGLLDEDLIDTASQAVEAAFERADFAPPSCFVASPGPGAHRTGRPTM